jgi:tetratricopeptide (TPR) repeat protein
MSEPAPSTPSAAAYRSLPPALRRLLAEQPRRWEAGDRRPVEELLAAEPALRGDAEAVLHLVFNEAILREAAGEKPQAEEYKVRFPHLSGELEMQFALDRAFQENLLSDPAERTTARDFRFTPPPADPEPAVPGYEVLAELGRGGMGVVYQAWQTGLGRVVALKMILAGGGPEGKELGRFRTEAEAAARLQHPNIVQVHAVGDHDGRPYLALEYVDGGSLAQKLNRTPQPAREAAALLETLARAVHHAHQKGVVHRDLKPANVLLTADGTPKVADFGLAKVLVGARAEHTRSGSILGTPSYMAPEQAEGKVAQVGPAADVYALGAILYECLTGRPPFKAAEVLETLRQVVQDDPVPPRRLQPGVPRDLETVCLKCLQKEPRKRYASALDLADDLRRFLDGRPIQARPVPAWERAAKWARRRPAAAALLAVSAAAAAGLLTLAAYWNEARIDAAEQQAKNLEQELAEERNLKARSEQVREGRRRALAAAERGDWPGAGRHLSAALALARAEPPLTDQLPELERDQARLKAWEEDRGRLPRFHALRQQVLAHDSGLTGRGRAADLAAVRRAAGEALALFTAGADGPPALHPEHFTAEERREFAEDAYVLLIQLAEATAEPLPGEQRPAQAKAALAVLDRAARLRTPTRAYHVRRAEYLDRLGRQDEAAADRRKAEALVDAPSAVDQYLLGAGLAGAGDPGAAVRHFEEVLHLEKGHFMARFQLAHCLLRTNRPAEAAAQFDACLAVRRDFAWAYLLGGFARGEAAAASPDRKAAEQGYRLAESLFRQAEALAPDEDARYGLHANRGATRLRHGQLQEAEADLLAALRLRPAQPHAALTLAAVRERQGRAAEGLQGLDAAIKLQGGAAEARDQLPLRAALHRTRARLRQAEGDLSGGLDDLREAIRLERQRGAAGKAAANDHRAAAEVLFRLRRYDECVKECAAALEHHPELHTAMRLQGDAYLQLGKVKEAAAAYDLYLQRAVPALDDFLRAGEPVADVFRARGLARTKLAGGKKGGEPAAAVAAALDDYTWALKLRPDARGHALRGWLYLVAKAPALALEDFQAALRLDARSAEALAGRGAARVQLGQYREAAADADAALALAPKEERTQFNAARVFAQAAARAEADPSLDGRQAAKLRDAYQARALGLLEEVLRGLPPGRLQGFWANEVRSDSAWAGLRTSPGFARLAREYRGANQ